MKQLLTSRKVLFGIVLLLVLINAALAYLYFSPKKVIVYNNSRYYSLSYRQTKLISDYFDKWQVFEKVSQIQQGNKAKIKQITIELTDEVQTQNQDKGPDSQGEILHSGRGTITPGGIFVAKVHLNRSLLESATEKGNLNQYVASEVMGMLFKATHDLRRPFTGSDLVKALREIDNDFKMKPEQNPFKVSIRNK